MPGRARAIAERVRGRLAGSAAFARYQALTRLQGELDGLARVLYAGGLGPDAANRLCGLRDGPDAGAMTPSISNFKMADLMRSPEIEFTPIARAKGLQLIFVPCSLPVQSDRALLRRLLPARLARGPAAPWFLCADLNALPLRGVAFDLVWSNLALQWVNDVPRRYPAVVCMIPLGLAVVPEVYSR